MSTASPATSSSISSRFFKGTEAVLDTGDGQQILHHGGESFGVVFDVVEQGDILLTAGLLAGQQYRGRPGDSSQRGAEVVGDGAKDIAADGLPGGLQLNGILFLRSGARSAHTGPWCSAPGCSASRAWSLIREVRVQMMHGDGRHAQHGHRVSGIAEREGGVGVHKIVVDAERAEQRGQDTIKISSGQPGYECDGQHIDQGGVVLHAELKQQPAEVVCPGHEKGGDHENSSRPAGQWRSDHGAWLSILSKGAPLPAAGQRMTRLLYS